jgi:excisionase family DNA binding protein
MTERLMTIPQVAQALGMSAAFVWRRVMTGEWPSYRFGRSRRMAQTDVAAVLAASRQAGSVVTTETPAAAE